MAKRHEKQKEQTIQRIVREVLWLQTLEQRGRDHLDFHEVSIWQIRRALEQAYEAGRASAHR